MAELTARVGGPAVAAALRSSTSIPTVGGSGGRWRACWSSAVRAGGAEPEQGAPAPPEQIASPWLAALASWLSLVVLILATGQVAEHLPVRRSMVMAKVGGSWRKVRRVLAVAQRAVTNVPLPLTVCTSPSARSTATALRTVWSATP